MADQTETRRGLRSWSGLQDFGGVISEYSEHDLWAQDGHKGGQAEEVVGELCVTEAELRRLLPPIYY